METSPRYLPRKGTETIANAKHCKRSNNLRHDIYPARGRKPLNTYQIGVTNRDPTSPRYLPRKGTETAILTLGQHGKLSSPRYLPRKGTETILRFWLFGLFGLWWSSPRYLPRKGTETIAVFNGKCGVARIGIFATIFTPQGDGNTSKSKRKSSYYQCSSPRYLPRKGTETAGKPKKNESKSVTHFATIFTPQGDGNSRTEKSIGNIPIATFATIFTPQGDGNEISRDRLVVLLETSPRYLPRKGTETLSNQ